MRILDENNNQNEEREKAENEDEDEEDLKQHVGLSDSSYVDMIYWIFTTAASDKPTTLLLLSAGGNVGVLGGNVRKAKIKLVS